MLVDKLPELVCQSVRLQFRNLLLSALFAAACSAQRSNNRTTFPVGVVPAVERDTYIAFAIGSPTNAAAETTVELHMGPGELRSLTSQRNAASVTMDKLCCPPATTIKADNIAALIHSQKCGVRIHTDSCLAGFLDTHVRVAEFSHPISLHSRQRVLLRFSYPLDPVTEGGGVFCTNASIYLGGTPDR